MLRLVWRETALDDLDRIVSYIGERDFGAAVRMQAMVEACAERLIDHPFMYRPGRLPETREAIVHANYVMVYKVGRDAIEILNVIHSRREYPPTAG